VGTTPEAALGRPAAGAAALHRDPRHRRGPAPAPPEPTHVQGRVQICSPHHMMPLAPKHRVMSINEGFNCGGFGEHLEYGIAGPSKSKFPGYLKCRSQILEKQTVESPYCTILWQI